MSLHHYIFKNADYARYWAVPHATTKAYPGNIRIRALITNIQLGNLYAVSSLQLSELSLTLP